MISHKYKFIFIHIPKAAGTSIEIQLSNEDDIYNYNYQGEINGEKILPFGNLRKKNLANTLNAFPDYYTFTFVRNPFSRIVSAYQHSIRYNRPYYDKDKPLSGFDDYIQRLYNVYIEGYTIEYVGLSKFDAYHTMPQVKFLPGYTTELFGIPVKRNINFIGRVENIDNDFTKILTQIGLDEKPLEKHLQKSNCETHWSAFFTEAICDLVKEIYAEDFKYLEYSTDCKSCN